MQSVKVYRPCALKTAYFFIFITTVSSFSSRLVRPLVQSKVSYSLQAQSKPIISKESIESITPEIVVQDLDSMEYMRQVKTTVLWVAAAALFAGGIAFTKGTTSAIEFVSGYVLEQSLSVDNLFVFLVLFDYFKVEKENQTRVLNYGIYGAIILRGIFVAAGSVALQQFHQVLLVFAAVLFASSYGILAGGADDDEEDLSDNWIVKLSNKYFKSTDKFDGERFFTPEGLATPLLLCLICIELSDVVFAFDSVPAVFGVTQDPFVVYTSNIFAIAGLRSLFAVLSKAVSELKYLEKAVGLVLAFIGVKLAAEAIDVDLVTPLQSLGVVLTLLGGGIGASLWAGKTEASASIEKEGR